MFIYLFYLLLIFFDLSVVISPHCTFVPLLGAFTYETHEAVAYSMNVGKGAGSNRNQFVNTHIDFRPNCPDFDPNEEVSRCAKKSKGTDLRLLSTNRFDLVCTVGAVCSKLIMYSTTLPGKIEGWVTLTICLKIVNLDGIVYIALFLCM